MNESSSQKLQKLVEKYLDMNVKAPSFETIEKDSAAQNRIADLLILLQVAMDSISQEGLSFDKDYLVELSKPEIQERINALTEFLYTGYLDERTTNILDSDSSRKYLFTYVSRELNWVVVSILSASYVSAHIIMRSILELLIGIATRETGSMSKRINSIPFISSEEKKKVNELWSEFCAWSHPYRKWEEEVCPIFALQKPIYHQKLCKLSLDKLERIIDLLLVIALEKFEIGKQGILSELNARSVDTSNLAVFQAHINPNRGK